MSYFAEKDANGKILRVIVCDSLAWINANLGGTWVETKMADPVEDYAGPGMYHSASATKKFVHPWKQPASLAEAPAAGKEVWHKAKAWENVADKNLAEPGVAGWTPV